MEGKRRGGERCRGGRKGGERGGREGGIRREESAICVRRLRC